MVRPTAFAAALVTLLAIMGAATADEKLEVHYSASLAGVAIAKGALVIQINDEGYSAAGSAMITGLLKAVTPGEGSASARGHFIGGKVMPASYSVTSKSRRRSEDIRMTLAAGVVSEESVKPAQSKSKDRIPITKEHRTSVVDPMSAAIMPVIEGDLSGAAACDRTLPIYDGRYRYDLVLSYERTDTVRDVKGFSGRVAVCRVAYRPIAGHKPNRQTEHATENRNVFVWLAPVAGTRVLIPLRVTVATVMGTVVVQATRFASKPRERTRAESPAAR